MKIQEKDLFHGAALTQIVEHPSFKAVNLASKRYGHYLVNLDRQVFVKYRKTPRSPWVFVFQPDEIAAIAQAVRAGEPVFLCLVCGRKTVCALNQAEITQVLDLDTGKVQQSIRVEVPKGGSCHLRGSGGALRRTVPHNSFPNKVFA